MKPRFGGGLDKDKPIFSVPFKSRLHFLLYEVIQASSWLPILSLSSLDRLMARHYSKYTGPTRQVTLVSFL